MLSMLLIYLNSWFEEYNIYYQDVSVPELDKPIIFYNAAEIDWLKKKFIEEESDWQESNLNFQDQCFFYAD